MRISDAAAPVCRFLSLWRGTVVCTLLFCLVLFPGISVGGEEMKVPSAAAILHDLKCFRELGSVLYIAAHPDDENTELLTYLARGRCCRTGYLSLTRGDGGQNVLGSDLGARLGVARTQELLAARRMDGAQQFFTRAIDFGFSKSYKDTLNTWDKQEVLSDIVRVIRKFRPDVLITRFSLSPGGTHGQHTASAILALEAFKVAGDPKAFPEQGLAPWQPKRIFWNVSIFQRDKASGLNPMKIDISGKDPVSGEDFTDIASKSRAMHKTQGLGSFRVPGATGGARMESFQILDGEPASTDILEGIDTTWNRIPGAAVIGKEVGEVITQFKAGDPSASVPALLKLRKDLRQLNTNTPVLTEKQALLDRILKDCLGLQVETTVSQHEVVPGDSMKLRHAAITKSAFPIRWTAVRYPSLNKTENKAAELKLNEATYWDSIEALPKSTPLSQAWWLRCEGTEGMYRTDEPYMIGEPENPPDFPIENVFEVDGQSLVIPDEPIQITTDSAGKELHRHLDVIPPASLKFASSIALLRPGESRTIPLELVAARANTAGVAKLQVPPEWKVTPAEQSFHLSQVGQQLQLKFILIAPAPPAHKEKEHTRSHNVDTEAADASISASKNAPSGAGIATILACVEIHGSKYCSQKESLNYTHFPPQLLQFPATLKAVCVDLKTRGHVVGYLPGAGDNLQECLKEMGYSVQLLDDATLTAEKLKDLDAVVIGVRAFNVRENISKALPALFDYVHNGGIVIAQYNRPDSLKADKLAPYDMHISGDRVTDRKSTAFFLAPEHPVLNKPNKITSADFDGWVQERAIYCPNQWDEHFTPVVAFNDPGEAPCRGCLLAAPYGKGYYIYTGLVFFRELPAGVPGAYRLFANLLSLNK